MHAPSDSPFSRAAAAEWLRQRLRLSVAPHPRTIARWQRGEGTKNGVRLRAIVLGSRSWYAAADLEAFIVALNAEDSQ